MTKREKIKAIKQRIELGFNGVEKIEIKSDSKGRVKFKYHMVKNLETFPQDIDQIIKDSIKNSQAQIKFLKGLLK